MATFPFKLGTGLSDCGCVLEIKIIRLAYKNFFVLHSFVLLFLHEEIKTMK